jgi:hypothetical protein
MSNINPLKFGVTGNQYIQKDTKEDLAKQTTNESVAEKEQKKQLGSNDVFGFLAAQNADLIPVKPTRTYEVSKYVNAEQEARITSFVKGLEADYEDAFATTTNEFPEISQKAAGEIALAYINASYK